MRGRIAITSQDDYIGGGGSSLAPAGGVVTEASNAGHGRVILRYAAP